MASPRLPLIWALLVLNCSYASLSQESAHWDAHGSPHSVNIDLMFSAFPAAIPPKMAPSITVVRGTHVLMILTSPLHTVSGVEGSGVYLETLQPVVQDNQIVIPLHTRVQGTVEANKRPGHFRRTAELKFRFTTLIFPNNHVVTINGALQSIPGSRDVRLERKDRKLKTVDQTEKVVVGAVVGATGGALLGSISGLGIGALGGAGLGSGFGVEASFLQRGDDISLRNGTQVEMVLENPFVLDPEQAELNAQYGAPENTRLQQSAAETRPRIKRRVVDPRNFAGVHDH